MNAAARYLSKLLLLAALSLVAACANMDVTTKQESGTFSVDYDSAGGIVSLFTGTGKMALNDGSEYAFSFDGYGLGALGYSQGSATGKVYNLTQPSDLNGEYGAGGAAAVFGSGSGKGTLRNRSNDVLLEVDSEQSGLRFGAGGGFVTLKLGRMLKGPPQPAPRAEPAPPPKPTRYEIEFGFDKSRVSIAIGKQIDAVLADWKGKDVSYRVVGHADMVGSGPYNMKLSTDRANNVKQAMIQRGVPAARINAAGVGQADLAVPTPPGQRLRANRRVVITIQQ